MLLVSSDATSFSHDYLKEEILSRFCDLNMENIPGAGLPGSMYAVFAATALIQSCTATAMNSGPKHVRNVVDLEAMIACEVFV